MKYLDYINNFWRINESAQLPLSAVCLYFYLLHASNRAGWCGYVILADAKIMADLSVQRTALSSARLALERVGLIHLRNRGNGRGKTVYDIIPPSVKNCTKRADSHQFPTAEETAQNIQISTQEICTKRAFKNVKNCTENCTKRADSHLINNILSNSNELSNIFSYKTKNNVIDSEYKYSSSTTSAVDGADVVSKKFFEEISDMHFVRHATLALSIAKEEYLRHAETVIAEWLLYAPENFLPENSPHRHLINQVRIKRDCPHEQNAQATARAKQCREQEQKAQAERELKESTELRGRVALEAYKASKGQNPHSSLQIPHYTEADAIQDVRKLFASEIKDI